MGVLARTWKPFPYANKDIYDAKNTLMVSPQSYFLTKSFFIIFYKINVTVFYKRLTVVIETVGFVFILLLFFEETLKKELKQRKHVSMLVQFDIFMNCVPFLKPANQICWNGSVFPVKILCRVTSNVRFPDIIFFLKIETPSFLKGNILL